MKCRISTWPQTILFLSLLLFGCSSISPELLAGTLLISDGRSYYELPINSPADITEWRIADTGFKPVSISPDYRYLLYCDEQLHIYDTDTKETRALPSVSCSQQFRWSPTSSKFSYGDGSSLYIYDLSLNTSIHVYTAPSDHYFPGAGLSKEYSGEVTLGVWIGPNRLVFQRFTGVMPYEITIPGYGSIKPPELRPNTTSLAILGEDVELLDSDFRFDIREVSADNSLYIINIIGNENYYLTQSFEDFAGMRTTSLPISTDCLFVGFVNNTNELFFIDVRDDRFYFVDPDTKEVLRGPETPTDIKSLVWVGDSEDKEIIFYSGPIYYMNLENGRSKIIVDASIMHELHFVDLLAWFP